MTVLAAGYTTTYCCLLFMTGTTITHNLMKKDYFSRNTTSTSLAILAICPWDILYMSSQDSALWHNTNNFCHQKRSQLGHYCSPVCLLDTASVLYVQPRWRCSGSNQRKPDRILCFAHFPLLGLNCKKPPCIHAYASVCECVWMCVPSHNQHIIMSSANESLLIWSK